MTDKVRVNNAKMSRKRPRIAALRSVAFSLRRLAGEDGSLETLLADHLDQLLGSEHPGIVGDVEAVAFQIDVDL